MLIVLMILIVILPVYVMLFNQAKKQINNQNEIILENLCESIDNELVGVESEVTEFSLDKNIAKIAEMSLPLSSDDNFFLYDYMTGYNPLKSYRKASKSQCEIYFGNIDIILTGSGMNTRESLLEGYNMQKYVSIENWTEFLNGFYKGQYVKLEKKDDQIFYIKTIAESEKTGKYVNVFFAIDRNWIEEKVNDLYLKDYGILKINDSSGNSIMTFDASEGQQNHRSYMTVTCESSVNNWKYTYNLPDTVVFGQLKFFVYIFIFSLILGVTMEIFLVKHYVSKNYTPVREMVQIFSKEKNEAIADEYGYLTGMINRSIKEKESLINNLDAKSQTIIKYILNKLVSGEMLTSAEHECLESLKFDFGEGCFITLQFKVYGTEEMFFEEKALKKDEDADVSTAYFIILNIFSEMLEKNSFEYMNTENEDGCTYIICAQNSDVKTVMKICGEALDFINKNFNFSFYCAAGSSHRGYAGIAESFAEGMQVMTYMQISKKSGVGCYNDIHEEVHRINGYPGALENQLITYVQNGNIDAVRKTLDEMFDSVFGQYMMTPDEIRFFIIDLATSAIKILAQTDSNDNIIVRKKMQILNNLMKSTDIEDMKKQISEIFELSCEQARTYNSSNSILTKKIVKFVKENYSNPDLNVSLVAQKFERHSHYISNVFRTNMNMRLLDYINLLRIEESKKLLKESDELVSNIAEKVGFYNYRTFIRVFTNIVGVSPSKFRNPNSD